jgi:cag pathogenicity island protein 24
MKFRMLTEAELEILKDDFIKFLVVNGIDAAEWQRIKGDEPIRAVKMLEQFSDFVLDQSLGKVEYLEYLDKGGIKVFKLDTEEIQLIGIDSDLVFMDENAFLKGLGENPTHFKIYTSSKKYFPDRNTEVFKMIQNGAQIIKKERWDMLNLLNS